MYRHFHLKEVGFNSLGAKIIMLCRFQARGQCLLNCRNKTLFNMVVYSFHLPIYDKIGAAKSGLGVA